MCGNREIEKWIMWFSKAKIPWSEYSLKIRKKVTE